MASQLLTNNNGVIASTNPLHVDTPTPTVLRHNQVTVATAGTRVQLSVTSLPLVARTLQVTAFSTNPNFIFVGGSGVTSSNGHRLAAGESVILSVDDVNKVYVDADTGTTNKVSFIGS